MQLAQATVGHMDRRYLAVKRALDLAGSLVGLAATALLYLPVAVAIKLDSPGPVIFAQRRLGEGERIFRLYKFRTMRLDSDGNGQKPEADDERVTRVGRVLRRTSLDEMPQFYNVLRGEMSLVGPRPEQQAFAHLYQGEERLRFSVRPGLTGWWQVNGRKQPMYDNAAEDLHYVRHRSLRLDLEILWRTASAVLSGNGAR